MTEPQPHLQAGTDAALGAHWDRDGVNFAIHSRHAERVELCLFDASGMHETARLPLPSRSGDIWHGYLPGAAPGLLYGYRVHGPYDPQRGQRFNRHKLLLDPYARALHGRFIWHDAVYGHRAEDSEAVQPEVMDTRDSAPYVPRCRVCAPLPQASRPPRPQTPWRDTVIYEMHARGFSKLHPDVPAPLRGTVAALAEPTVIGHLLELGVTAVELMPVAAFLDEWHLVRQGLTNYWGYNPIAPAAMHAPYLAGGDIAEFAHTVDRLHEAGLEVILDVVFNHTAEGDERGPTLAFRGLDNATYYRLQADDRRHYVDITGCGNTLDVSQPAVVRLILDVLRYWACDVGVDGFRFDLASVLMRDAQGQFDAHGPLLAAIADDPQLRSLKWIAEPWDLGAPGYFLGAFGPPFAEWNDHYRDSVRRFWRGDGGQIGELATRLAGSSDVFAASGRAPSASINFITAHDGFTLADLTAYADKHNLANGEDNRDGTTANWSSNGGVEGETDDTGVLERRRRLRTSLLGTVLLSQGTPMLRAGDELSQSKRGNNNTYCQDNASSWLDWSARGDPWRDLRAFTHTVVHVRRQLEVLRRERFFDGEEHAAGSKDIVWLRPDGDACGDADWEDDSRRSLAVLMTQTREASGDDTPERVYMACHSGDAPQRFRLPQAPGVERWLCVVDGDDPLRARPGTLHAPGSCIEVSAGGLRVLVPHDTHGLGLSPGLAAAAQQAGVATDYVDIAGERLQPPAEGVQRIVHALDDTRSVAPYTAASWPTRCWLPEGLLEPPGRWAFSVQLYGLRSAHSGGIGDFLALAQLIEVAADLGADGILCSPVHAPSLTRTQCASPYSPSNRLMLNPLFIALPWAAGEDPPRAYQRFMAQPDVTQALRRVEAAESIDYPAVSALKLRALEHLHEAFQRQHLGPTPSAQGEAFLRFRARGGDALRDHAVFEALNSWFMRRHARHVPWQEWPAPWRDPRSVETAAFASEHATQVGFHVYLQWLARGQWHRVAAKAREAGMQLGLIANLALGADLDSAETWRGQALAATDMELGAPPDAFSPTGQHWGLPPWNPHRLVADGFAPFDALLDAVMQGAGAIRMDHVMGLLRQFWIPRGQGPAQGAYVHYPFEHLLGRVAQASLRHRCAVIGEDLGNVPEGLRARMAEARMLGFRVAYFERDGDGRFLAPSSYAPWTVATASTHDLPTTAGFYEGADIQERSEHALFPSPRQLAAAQAERSQARRALSQALQPYGESGDAASFTSALHRFLAASHSRLVLVQLEDVLEVQRQANLPDLGDVAPNWRRRLPVAVESLARDPRVQALADIFARRHRRVRPAPA